MALNISREIAQLRNRGDNWLARALEKIQAASVSATQAIAPTTPPTQVLVGGGVSSAGVTSLNSLQGDLTVLSGTGMQITPVGKTITIDLPGSITLSGNLSANSLTLTTPLAVSSGGWGTSTGSFTSPGSVSLNAGGTNQNITLTPSGTGFTILNGKVGIGTATPQTALDVNGQARVLPVTVSQLPAAGAAIKGAIACVTDATATTYFSIVAGSGTNIVMVFCDGTNWRIF